MRKELKQSKKHLKAHTSMYNSTERTMLQSMTVDHWVTDPESCLRRLRENIPQNSCC